MLKILLRGAAALRPLVVSLTTLALLAAAHFGYRCPAQGCPACRLIGH